MNPTPPIRRSAALVVACILVSAITGMVLGRVAVSDATITSGERPATVTIQPFRILETRGASVGGPIGVPVSAPLGQGQVLSLQVAGVGDVPATATGVIVNVTAVNATADTFVTLYPAGGSRPNASTLNPFPGRTTFNSTTVDLPASGRLSIYNNAGTVDLIIDVTGYTEDHEHPTDVQAVVRNLADFDFVGTATALCPVGTTVTGGGGIVVGTLSVAIVASGAPVAQGGQTGYTIVWVTLDLLDDDVAVTVSARCVRGANVASALPATDEAAAELAELEASIRARAAAGPRGE